MGCLLAEGGVEIVSKDTLAILYFLLPGLITAAIYYSLTAHPKREVFDRTVQALIFTVIIRAMNITVRKLWWIWWHPKHQLGAWTDEKELVWSVVNAIVLGLLVSVIVNWDLAHCVLRRAKVTRRTSYPSEWYSAFHRFRRDVIVYLKDGRRLRAWAEEYPDQSDRGHFILQNVKWLDDKGKEYPQSEVLATVVAVSDVEMIQFMPESTEDLSKPLEQVEEDKARLIALGEAEDAENSKVGETKAKNSNIDETIKTEADFKPPLENS